MNDTLFKIFIFGDSGCVQRFLTNLFVSFSDPIMTIGVDLKLKALTVDGNKVILQIWYFRGEERFKFQPAYSRGSRGGVFLYGARGGMFLYDITNFLSIAHIDDWLSFIRKEIRAEDMFPIIVVGNRAHLADQREVSSAEGIMIAKSRGVNGFIEVSAKTGKNVEKAFEELTRLMLDYSKPRALGFRPASTDTIGLEQDPEFQGLIEKKIRRILALEKEKKFSRAFMDQNLEQWLETLKGLKKGCEEIIKFLKHKRERYYHHISFEQWKYLLRVSSELLEEFKEKSSSFYKMSDDAKRKLYSLFEIFIPCREILSDGSFGKNVRVTFEEYLKILKLEKKNHK
jgi:GTPase SAR1 family protein